ncbi:MAG: hypothetical protein ABIT69_02125 [Sphingomicrobium sp.]
MTDEAQWKRRFTAFILIRIAAVVMIGLGMTIGFTALIRPGGERIGGAALVAIGTIVLALGPVWLRKRWADEDQ